MKAVVSLALCVAEAELVVGLPGVGVGEGVHTAAGTGAVHEGTFQQVNWSHGQSALLQYSSVTPGSTALQSGLF